MPDHVEPPVLLSRLMTFVFATALVVLGALGITLWQLFPLDRPQVFFLTTQMRPDMEVRLYSMPLKSDKVNTTELYLQSFVKEYIKARNEIIKNANVMQRKWGNGIDGVVNMWSSPAVFEDFSKTAMREALMYSDAIIDISCTVEFPAGGVRPYRADGLTWEATFNYICANNDGQLPRKEYKIIVELEKEDDTTIKWGDRLNNPLGVHVRRYEIESGNGDPLNFE
ncbi:MAG: hypothetical protein K2I81_00915 [Alphaproteobacteria bacterium]|nr:hypothetical protein [Alphaproteobacteria bacterium]